MMSTVRLHPRQVKKSFWLLMIVISFCFAPSARADLSLTSGANITTTPNVATAVTGFQIVGPADTTTPVQLRVTNGTLSMSTTTGLTFDGASSGSTINFSGTVANINAALATLTYTRATVGSDTLEVSLVNKGEIFFTDNNHLYQFVSGGYTWYTAKSAAEAQTAYGASGYLATITSSAENAFIKDRLSGDGWIGASDATTEGTWKWVTGPESGTTFWQGNGGGSTVGGNYANWAGGEPNEAGTGEDCAETYVASGTWNDYPCTVAIGYVVEFGAPGNLPTVVAQNISITTADVPAVTSLSPTNGATDVATATNLVIGFSKTVTVDTGNILIKKSSDNSTVATIDVTGGEISGGGTNTITINPSAALPEQTSLYVTIPNTAFKDSSDNYFEGISNNSTWSFTTADETPPALSSITSTVTSDTAATINWTTDENASTKLLYGLTSAKGQTTSETDTGTRVTAHSVSLTSLLSCTTYYFSVYSRDASLNAATSSTTSFTTTGCEADSAPSATTATAVTVNAGGSVASTYSGKTLTVEPPADFTDVAASVVIQIKPMAGAPVYALHGTPSYAWLKAGSDVFDVKAIYNNTEILDSFDAPITLTYVYADADVAGLDENTLRLYHYHNGAWEALTGCSVNTSSNTVVCSTTSFSVFALFGQVPATQGGNKVHYGCKDPKASNYEQFSSHRQALCVYEEVNQTAAAAGVCAPTLTSYIKFNDNNDPEQVKKLEIFLNEKQGEKLAVDGVYGEADVAAVKRFQQKYASEVLGVWGLTEPTGYVFRTTLMKINSFYCNQNLTCPVFTEYNSLSENSVSPEVQKTKTLLSELGFYSGQIDTKFDQSLDVAIRNFQETFSETMLKPWQLSQGTGYKYKTTNKFLNMLVGCKTGAVELDGQGTFEY